MVRNILDSMSELSKSIGQDGDSSLVNGSGIGAEIDGMCISTKNTTTTTNNNNNSASGNDGIYGKSALDNTTLSNTLRNAGVSVERVDSVTGIVGAVRIGSDEGKPDFMSCFFAIFAITVVTVSPRPHQFVQYNSLSPFHFILFYSADNYANASTFDQLLAEAGVTLDAMSLLSSEDPLKQGSPSHSHSQYTQGTIGVYEPSLSMSQVLQEVTGPGE